MSSYDNEAANDNKTETELEGPSNKTFHYVSLPRVILERIDDQVLSNVDTGKSYVTKKQFKKPIKLVSKKSGRRTLPGTKNPTIKNSSINNPGINSLPEKRRIKLTNKGEETLHIVDFRCNSSRRFIMEDQDYNKSIGNVIKQDQSVPKENQRVMKNNKTIQKPLLVVRSKTEINKLADKKLNSRPVVPIIKQECTRESGQDKNNLQNKQTEVIDHPYGIKHDINIEKGSSGGVQVNKGLQNKQREAAVSHSHDVKHTNTEKQNAGRIQVSTAVNKKVQTKRGMASLCDMKHNASTAVVQVNKSSQNKQTESVSHPYCEKHNTITVKENASTVQVNKNLQNKRTEVVSHQSGGKLNASTAAVQVYKNLQTKQTEVVSHQCGVTHNASTAEVQFNKNLQNKQTEVVSDPYAEKQNSDTEKAVSPVRNKISMSKEILSMQTLSSSVKVNTQGASPAKRKLSEEHHINNKVQKLCKSPDIVGTENAGVNSTSFVNNMKVPPDRKTAKVVPLAKARKTLPKPNITRVNEVKSSIQLSAECGEHDDESTDKHVTAAMLTELTGRKVQADKIEVLFRNENKDMSGNKTPFAPPSKKNQGISNLSKLLSDSLRPSTSDTKIIASSSALSSLLSASSSSSASTSTLSPSRTSTATIITSTTTNKTVTTPVSVPGKKNIPTTTSSPVHTKGCALAHDHLCTKMLTSVSSPANFSSNASATQSEAIKNSVVMEVVNSALAHDHLCIKTPTSGSSPADFNTNANTAQPATIKNSVEMEVVNNVAKQQSLSQSVSSAEDAKTIYDVMADVSVLYPAWNLHILEDTNTFCIAYIARNSAGVPAIVKCIELDEQFNAKVYIHQNHCKQFDGQYNDEDSIVSLVNKVHTLKA